MRSKSCNWGYVFGSLYICDICEYRQVLDRNNFSVENPLVAQECERQATSSWRIQFLSGQHSLMWGSNPDMTNTYWNNFITSLHEKWINFLPEFNATFCQNSQLAKGSLQKLLFSCGSLLFEFNSYTQTFYR